MVVMGRLNPIVYDTRIGFGSFNVCSGSCIDLLHSIGNFSVGLCDGLEQRWDFGERECFLRIKSVCRVGS